MPKGIFLTIGLNHVDPNAYPNIDVPELFGCENDARNMAQLLGGVQGFVPTASQSLIGSQATRSAVQGFISNAANTLVGPGDLFVVHHSGHGMQAGVDSNGQIVSSSDLTAWVLFDGPLPKEELDQGWFAFQPGVRIVILDDSCFSGSGLKSVVPGQFQFTSKSLPSALSFQVAQQNAPIFQEAAKKKSTRLAGGTTQTPQAAVLLISGCGPTQESEDVTSNGNDFGLFTSVLISVFNGTSTSGTFTGSYDDYAQAVQQQTSQQALSMNSQNPQDPQEEGIGDIVATSDLQQSSPPFAV
jgi:hypothetical protein